MGSLIQLCRTITPVGLMTFSRNPSKGDYSCTPVSMQPEAYADGGDFYAYNKGVAFEDHDLRFANIPNTDLTNFRTFLDTAAVRKTHPFLYRDQNGKVWLARFTSPDQIKWTPVTSGRESLDGLTPRLADSACHTSGSATLANSTIVLTDGAAAVDFNAANVLTDHLGMLIDVFDSALNRITGFIKAAVSTGVTIVNSPGGTTYNWLTNDAGFNAADPAGFTYKIYSEGM